MYGMLFMDLAMLALVAETIRLGAGIRRAVVWRGAYPVMAFATIGAAVEWLGVPFAVYASMYIAGLISAFLGPLVAMIFDYRGGRGAQFCKGPARADADLTTTPATAGIGKRHYGLN